MIDKVVDDVIKKYQYRSEIGARKYGTTLHENNFDNYLLHLQQELQDATLYIEKIMQTKEQVLDLIKQYSNDQELGQAIRQKFTK